MTRWLTDDPHLTDAERIEAEAQRHLARREAEIERLVNAPIGPRRVPWRWIAGAVVVAALVAWRMW